MSACNCCEEPECRIEWQAWHSSPLGEGNGDDIAGAWTASEPGEFQLDGSLLETGTTSMFVTSDDTAPPGAQYQVFSRSNLKYRPRFFCASCYVKIWWDEVIQIIKPDFSVVTISTTPKEYERTIPQVGDSGSCVPDDFDPTAELPSDFPVPPEDQDNPSSLEVGDSFEIDLPIPELDPPPDDEHSPALYQYSGFVANIRFTCIPGYEAPEDGSANGFPVVVPCDKPENTSIPEISDDLAVGVRAECSTGIWLNTPIFFYYQWFRHDPIGGTTVPIAENTFSYLVTSADIGFQLKCVVTAYNHCGKIDAESALTDIIMDS